MGDEIKLSLLVQTHLAADLYETEYSGSAFNSNIVRNSVLILRLDAATAKTQIPSVEKAHYDKYNLIQNQNVEEGE